MPAEQMSRVAAARFWQFVDDQDPGRDDLAEEFHEASKLYRSTVARAIRADILDASLPLRQSAAIGARELVHLPLIAFPAIDPEAERRTRASLIRLPSCRTFSPQEIGVSNLGRLLWLSYGAYPQTHGTTMGRRRPVASGGALYPLEIYVIASLGGADKGLYHYNVHRHGLNEVRRSVTLDEICGLGEPSDLLGEAGAIVFIASLFWRTRFKYGLRGYRFALLEAGAFIQQMTLVAQHMGLGVVPFAGLFDDKVEQLCEIDGVDESFINAVVLGVPS